GGRVQCRRRPHVEPGEARLRAHAPGLGAVERVVDPARAGPPRPAGSGHRRPRGPPGRQAPGGRSLRRHGLRPGHRDRSALTPDTDGRRGTPASSRIPSANPTRAWNPRRSAARAGEANTCRTSPARYSPVTTGRGAADPNAEASASAISPTVCASPLATLSGPVTAGSALRARTFAAATSLTWTKSRRCPP